MYPELVKNEASNLTDNYELKMEMDTSKEQRIVDQIIQKMYFSNQSTLVEIEDKLNEFSKTKYDISADQIISNKRLGYLYRKNAKYKVQNAGNYNILIAGNTKVGKSCFLKQIRYPILLMPDDVNIFSDTVNPSIHNLVIVDENNTSMSVNFIDSPGLFEEFSKENSHLERSNEKLKGVINFCVKQEITKINLILLTIKYDEHVRQSLEAVRICYKNLSSNSKKRTALLITHCEGTTRVERGDFVAQLKSANRFDEIFELLESKVFFSGILKEKSHTIHADTFTDVINCLQEFRTDFLDWVFKDSKNEGLSIVGEQLIKEDKKNCQIM